MRELPNSIEAEKNILGSCMMSEKALNTAIIKVDRKMFLRKKHKLIFRSIQSLYSKDHSINQMTVINHLKDKNKLNKCEGAYYITGLVESTVSPASIGYHIKVLAKKYKARVLIQKLKEKQNELYKQDDPNKVISDISNFMMEIENNSNKKPYHSFNKAVNEGIEHINNIFDGDHYTGIKTGYYDFDNLTGGFQNGLHILGARPSMGKTAWAINQVQNMAENNYRIGFISLETEKEWFTLRILSALTKTNSQKFNNGNLKESEFIKLNEAADNIMDKYKIFIDDSFLGNTNKIAAKIKTMKKIEKIDICYIDYLQLMSEKTGANRNLEIGNITRKLSKLSKQIEIPIILICQLSRKAEGKLPKLSHLRDSGEIEQDADSVTFLWRPEQNGKKVYKGEEMKGKAIIKVAKWRNGETGIFKLKWFPEYTKFENLAGF